LSPGDIVFLRARESYLGADQRIKFAQFIEAPADEDAKPKKK